MSEESRNLVLQKIKTFLTGMAKVHIKFDKLTPSGGIFRIMEYFDALLLETIDHTLGYRCKIVRISVQQIPINN